VKCLLDVENDQFQGEASDKHLNWQVSGPGYV